VLNRTLFIYNVPVLTDTSFSVALTSIHVQSMNHEKYQKINLRHEFIFMNT